MTFAAAKAWEASDRTSPAAPSVKPAACSLGASSLGSCRFLCRWRSAQIGRCFAGAFATPFAGAPSSWFLACLVHLAAEYRVLSTPPKGNAVPNWDRFWHIMPYTHNRLYSDTVLRSRRGGRSKASPGHGLAELKFRKSRLALRPRSPRRNRSGYPIGW